MRTRLVAPNGALGQTGIRLEAQTGRNATGRVRLMVSCTGGLKAKGKRHLARDITVKRLMGEGSFGQVFEVRPFPEALSEGGVFEGRDRYAKGDVPCAVRQIEALMQGAVEMSEMEHVLNVYASKVCRESVADFMGYCGVSTEEANGNLTPGTWLVWKFQGDKTLATYMRRRDTLPALAEDLGIPESEVPRTVLKQILNNLKGLHSAGLVHRDVKPSNLVLSTEEKAFKFIDLGACADLRLGTNYVPDESILDAVYCPPEQYVLPTDAPHLSNHAFSMVISPMLWSRHKPDRFDVFSAGLIFLQLAVPTLCSERAMKSFKSSFEQHKYDLQEWRKSSALLSRHTQILDANDGAGWNLLEQMLRPRGVEESDDGTVSFVDSDEELLRISVDEALGHDFFKAAEQTEQKPLMNLFRKYTRALFDLEGKILNQVIETEQQTTTVKKLQTRVAKGEASQQELQREEKKLTTLQTGLKGMQNEFVSLSKMAFEKFGVRKRDTPAEEILESVDAPESKLFKIPFLRLRRFVGVESTREGKGESKPLFGWFRGKGVRPEQEDATSPALVLGRPENLIYMGLKFTGLAARVAGDLAKSVKEDAEKLMTEIETENSQKRQREMRDRAFLEMLKASRVTLNMSYSSVEKQCCQESAFQDVSPDRRQLLFAAYVRALTERQAKTEHNAEGELRKLLVDYGVDSKSEWKTVSAELSKNPVFLAVGDANQRQQIFEQVQKQQIQQSASQNAESQFRALLRDATPTITGMSSWPRVKQQIYDDPRFQAVSEKRRRELFQEYRAIVQEIEQEEEESQRMKELEDLKSRALEETQAAETRLSELMEKRAKLKEEYQKMQSNLERMEKTLHTQKKLLKEKEGGVHRTSDGSVLYKFGPR